MNDANLMIDRDIGETLFRVRRAIHESPELSHAEFGTAELVTDELRAAGVEPTMRVGKTGLVFDVAGHAPGKTLAIRGDMDALPIQERTDLSFRSKIDGVMHACGHDTHTAMALATALHFARRRDSFTGVLRFLFQHSEEDLPSGAQEFVDAGCLDGVEAVIGIHVDPLLPSGTVAARGGVYACSSDHYDIEVSGISCHGGKPHEGVDAIATACSIVNEISRIRAHNTDPIVPLTITVGRIRGGSAYNIVSDSALLQGTIRAGGDGVRARAHARLREIAEGIAWAHGAKATVRFQEDAPVLVNDARMAELVRTATSDVAGGEAVLDAPMWTASDDFAYFSRIVPGVYFRLGAGNDALGYTHPLHHPEFAVDEAALPLGTAVLIRAAERYLLES